MVCAGWLGTGTGAGAIDCGISGSTGADLASTGRGGSGFISRRGRSGGLAISGDSDLGANVAVSALGPPACLPSEISIVQILHCGGDTVVPVVGGRTPSWFLLHERTATVLEIDTNDKINYPSAALDLPVGPVASIVPYLEITDERLGA